MKEFFSLRKKSYTLSPHFVKRKAHDRTEKSATEQSRKRGNPRRSSANFCGIRRTRRLLSEEKNRSKYPSKGLKARSPNFGSTAAQPALQQARGGKTRVGKFRAGKARDESRGEAQRRASPKATLRAPQSALAASPNKKSAASTPRYWLEVSNAESNAISERGKSNERTRAADSVAPWTLSMRPSSHSTESGPL